MKREIRPVVLLLAQLTIIVSWCLFLASVAGAKSIGLDANWRVSATGDELGDDDIHRYIQRYYLQWYPQVTGRINLTSNIDYQTRWTTGQGSTEYIAPDINLRVNNDLFHANVLGSGRKTNRSETWNSEEVDWVGEIGSNWEYVLWPQLAVRYGQSRKQDSQAVFGRDEDYDWLDMTVDWEHNNLRAYYNYFLSANEDHTRLTETDSMRHFARLEYNDSYWNNRINFDFSQQVDFSETTSKSFAGAEGKAFFQLNVQQARAANDSSPETGSLPSVPALIDGDTNVPAFTIRLNQPANLALNTDFQDVDLLMVYTTRNEDLLLADMSLVTWDVYTSDDGVIWTRQAVEAPSFFNEDEFRFEVRTDGLRGLFVKLVVTGWLPLLDIQVTEMEAYERSEGEDERTRETTSDTYKTDMNLGMQPTLNSWFSYNFSWHDSETDPGNKRNRLAQTASYVWRYSRYFEPTASVGNTITDNSDTVDTEYRNYGISIRSRPIDTFESTAGLTYYENFRDRKKFTDTVSVNWQNTALLYPGLTSEFDVVYSMVDNAESGTKNGYYNLRFSLRSRMRENLLVDFRSDYGAEDIEYVSVAGTTRTSGGRTALQINYYPSQILSFYVVGDVSYGDRSENISSVLFDTRLTLIRNRKINLSVGHRLNSSNKETMNTFDVNWTWNVSTYLTLTANANYLLREEGDSWYIDARLNARF